MLLLAACIACFGGFQDLDPGDLFGFVTADAGDLDGDGCRDFLVADPLDADWIDAPGRVWALSGRSLAVLFEWRGRAHEQLGHTLGSAGDLDADGIPELFLGTTNVAGAAYVHFVDGRTGRLDRSHAVIAHDSFDTFGPSCASIGDIDRDGVPDYALGSAIEWRDDTGSGRTWRPTGGQAIVLSGRTGDELWRVVDPDPDLMLGAALAAAGDVDADQVPDVLVGCPSARFREGRVALLSGRDGHPLRQFAPDRRVDRFGWSLSGSIDFDLDGKRDVVAVSSFDPRMAFGFAGATGELVRRWTVEAEVHYPTRAIVVPDSDGDCVDDLVLTAPASSFDESTVRLVSGRGDRVLWLLARSDYLDGNFGCSVTSIDDRDGDGVADLLIGTATYRTHEVSGRIDFCSGASGRTLDTLWRADVLARDAITGTTHPVIHFAK